MVTVGRITFASDRALLSDATVRITCSPSSSQSAFVAHRRPCQRGRLRGGVVIFVRRRVGCSALLPLTHQLQPGAARERYVGGRRRRRHRLLSAWATASLPLEPVHSRTPASACRRSSASLRSSRSPWVSSPLSWLVPTTGFAMCILAHQHILERRGCLMRQYCAAHYIAESSTIVRSSPIRQPPSPREDAALERGPDRVEETRSRSRVVRRVRRDTKKRHWDTERTPNSGSVAPSPGSFRVGLAGIEPATSALSGRS